MKENKINKFLLITSILSTIVLIIGGTFSYFTMSTRSDLDSLAVEAGKMKLGLGVSQKFPPVLLIPTNDDDIEIAYERKCIDDFGYGACLAYELDVSNFTGSQDIIGTINFTVENIENLSYMVLNDDDTVFLEKTKVVSGTDQSLGSNFIIENGSETLPTMRKFILLVWLTNIEDEDQTEADAGGSFSASVIYQSVSGGKVTGSISGSELDAIMTSHLEEAPL